MSPEVRVRSALTTGQALESLRANKYLFDYDLRRVARSYNAFGKYESAFHSLRL